MQAMNVPRTHQRDMLRQDLRDDERADEERQRYGDARNEEERAGSKRC